MYKITIIAALVIGTVAFAQGKSGHSKESGPSNKSNNAKVSGGNHNNSASAFGDQKGKENKGGSNSHAGPSHQSSPQHGNQGKGAPKGNHSPAKFVAPQGKGHGNDGHKSSNSKGSNGGGNKGYHPSKSSNMNHGNDHKGKGSNYKYDKGHNGSKGNNKHYDKGHVNYGYIYVNRPGYYSHKNYGQWRSQQAKMKHKNYHPVYEYRAVEGFNFIIVRNNFLYRETRDKIVLVRSGLLRQRNAGVITLVQYNTTMQRVYVLEQRRAALEINIVL